MCQQYVHAMRFWTERQAISAMPFNPEAFNNLEVEEWMQRMRLHEESKDADTDIKAPGPFK